MGMGAVGKPLGIAECKLAEDGELLVRGPSVFKGYWNRVQILRAHTRTTGNSLKQDFGNRKLVLVALKHQDHLSF